MIRINSRVCGVFPFYSFIVFVSNVHYVEIFFYSVYSPMAKIPCVFGLGAFARVFVCLVNNVKSPDL